MTCHKPTSAASMSSLFQSIMSQLVCMFSFSLSSCFVSRQTCVSTCSVPSVDCCVCHSITCVKVRQALWSRTRTWWTRSERHKGEPHYCDKERKRKVDLLLDFLAMFVVFRNQEHIPLVASMSHICNCFIISLTLSTRSTSYSLFLL